MKFFLKPFEMNSSNFKHRFRGLEVFTCRTPKHQNITRNFWKTRQKASRYGIPNLRDRSLGNTTNDIYQLICFWVDPCILEMVQSQVTGSRWNQCQRAIGRDMVLGFFFYLFSRKYLDPTSPIRFLPLYYAFALQLLTLVPTDVAFVGKDIYSLAFSQYDIWW